VARRQSGGETGREEEIKEERGTEGGKNISLPSSPLYSPSPSLSLSPLYSLHSNTGRDKGGEREREGKRDGEGEIKRMRE
jgi:hypothetical protein